MIRILNKQYRRKFKIVRNRIPIDFVIYSSEQNKQIMDYINIINYFNKKMYEEMMIPASVFE